MVRHDSGGRGAGALVAPAKLARPPGARQTRTLGGGRRAALLTDLYGASAADVRCFELTGAAVARLLHRAARGHQSVSQHVRSAMHGARARSRVLRPRLWLPCHAAASGWLVASRADRTLDKAASQEGRR